MEPIDLREIVKSAILFVLTDCVLHIYIRKTLLFITNMCSGNGCRNMWVRLALCALEA